MKNTQDTPNFMCYERQMDIVWRTQLLRSLRPYKIYKTIPITWLLLLLLAKNNVNHFKTVKISLIL